MTPSLRQTSTPDPGQFDSADQELDEDDLAGQLEFDTEEYDMETIGLSGMLTMA